MTSIRNGTLLILLFTLPILAQSQTKIKVYQAYFHENVLNPDIVIAQRYTGVCLNRSLASPARMDAWRCKSNTLYLDPCFLDGETLACISSPWSHRTTVLEPTIPLLRGTNNKVDVQHNSPWGLELANGQRCTLLTGASTMIGNATITYSCKSQSNNIIGGIDKSSSTWRVKLYDFNKKTYNVEDVSTAWY